AFLKPPMTSNNIPMREIGSVALDLLRDDLSGLPVPSRRVELACHLVERASTARVRASAGAAEG
ncbi:substrate-binding domain-containing protein, partial [Rhizobiaceae sp. 2RAB30]